MKIIIYLNILLLFDEDQSCAVSINKYLFGFKALSAYNTFSFCDLFSHVCLNFKAVSRYNMKQNVSFLVPF